MLRLKSYGSAVASMLLLCAQAPAPTMVFSPGQKLKFDFSSSPSGGIPVGAFDNFAFVLDSNNPDQKFALEVGHQRPGIIASFDYADCSVNQEALLERTVAGLAAGTAAFVDYVDVEIAPNEQKGLVGSGGFCIGFRTSTGWRWNLSSTPLAYDTDARVMRGRIWIKQPDVDALKLVFDYSVPRHSVRSVLVTTQPAGINLVR